MLFQQKKNQLHHVCPRGYTERSFEVIIDCTCAASSQPECTTKLYGGTSVVLYFVFFLQDLLNHVRQFVRGATREVKVPSSQQTSSALLLLQRLPSARRAVLEYLTTVFDEGVSFHLHHIEHSKGWNPDTNRASSYYKYS